MIFLIAILAIVAVIFFFYMSGDPRAPASDAGKINSLLKDTGAAPLVAADRESYVIDPAAEAPRRPRRSKKRGRIKFNTSIDVRTYDVKTGTILKNEKSVLNEKDGPPSGTPLQ